MKMKPWCSLRSKIVLALLVSSVAVSLIVAWRVETKLNSHFAEIRVQCSWGRLESLLQDVYCQYGSWTEALASPNFPALTPNYCLPSFWPAPEGETETARFVLTDAEGTVLAPTTSGWTCGYPGKMGLILLQTSKKPPSNKGVRCRLWR